MTNQSLVPPSQRGHKPAVLTLYRAAAAVRGRTAYAVLALLVLPQAALANMPTVAPPAGGGGGGLLGTLQGYAAMAAVLLGLLIATSAFFVVGGGAIGKFNEARQRNEWGSFAVTLVIGVMLIVAILWLANKAVTIL